jgi:hypothetical protein
MLLIPSTKIFRRVFRLRRETTAVGRRKLHGLLNNFIIVFFA